MRDGESQGHFWERVGAGRGRGSKALGGRGGVRGRVGLARAQSSEVRVRRSSGHVSSTN